MKSPAVKSPAPPPMAAATAQRKGTQLMADNRPQAAIQRKQISAIQRMGKSEDEPVLKKSAVAQRASMEEELKGKK